MNDKQTARDGLECITEQDVPAEDSEEHQIMGAIPRGRADVAAGRAMSREDAARLVESWYPGVAGWRTPNQ